MFRILLADLEHQIRKSGWRGGGRWLAERIASIPYRHTEYIVFARSLRASLPAATPRQPVTLRRAEADDLDHLEGVIPPSELRYLRRRLAHGRFCFLAFAGKDLAAYCWATTQVEPDIESVSIPLRPGDTYFNDAYTLPAYRRQGIQTAVHLYRLAYMRDLGYRRAVLIVAKTNAASQRLVHKLGYRKVSHLTYRRILWKRIFRYQPAEF